MNADDEALTLGDLIRANLADSFDQTARAVEGALGLTKLQRLVLHSLIVDEVRRRHRSAVRDLEPRFEARETVDPSADRSADRSAYIAETFIGLAGRRVTWGEATVADHEAHVAMLSKLRNGINATINAHEDAIATIAAAGVSCLNDLALAAVGDAA